jgi:hypothetical protein
VISSLSYIYSSFSAMVVWDVGCWTAIIAEHWDEHLVIVKHYSDAENLLTERSNQTIQTSD